MNTALLGLPVWATATLTGADSRYLGPGAQDEASVLINKLGDGTDLNVVWRELITWVDAINAYRGGLASLLTYETTAVAEPVPQSVSSDSFEPASEHGIPGSIGQDPVALLGFTFSDWSKRTAYTWRYLRSASADQVRNSFVRLVEADNRLVVGKVIQRLFSSAQEIEEDWGHISYPVFSGTGPTALPYLGKSFAPNHTHFSVSQAATIDSGDVEACMRLVTEHGYGIGSSSKLLILANPQEAEVIQSFRAGQTNNNSQKAEFDFVPSALAPPFLTQEHVVGQVAPESFADLDILGSYGRGWLLEHASVPAGYIAAVATGGPNASSNVIGFRQHVDPAWQGLKFIGGNWAGYPLQDAFAHRAFGTGVRHRGAAAVMQIKASGSYDTPAIAI